ncbi:MAG: hypothetical protein QM500_01475 [Methylococcales bacterium]
MTTLGLFFTAIACIVLSAFTGSTVATTLFVIIVIVNTIYVFFDRQKNPKKWAKIDKEHERIKKEIEKNTVINAASKYWENYEDATKRLPNSQWMLMNKEEKSAVLYKREQLKNEFYKLPIETRELIIKKYNIDTNFPLCE